MAAPVVAGSVLQQAGHTQFTVVRDHMIQGPSAELLQTVHEAAETSFTAKEK